MRRSAPCQSGPSGTGAGVTGEAKRPTRTDDRRQPVLAAADARWTTQPMRVCLASISETVTLPAARGRMSCGWPARMHGRACSTRPSRRCRSSCPRPGSSASPPAEWPAPMSRACQSTGRACSRSTGLGGNTSAIELEPWQQEIVTAYPGDFARGLFHSDGCRLINRVRRPLKEGDRWYEYPRYLFVNKSADIHRLCGEALDRLGWPGGSRSPRR